jgi:phytoene dehydrogenase-like protein
LCTSWKRQGYTFNGCISWLVGSGEGQTFNHIWQELDAVQGRPIVNHDEFLRIERASGEPFIMYTNIDRLEQHLKALAPADAKTIEEFATAVRHFARFDWNMEKPRELYSPLDVLVQTLKSAPHLRDLEKYSRISTREFARRFSDPFVREAFAVLFDLPDFPMMALLMTAAWMHNQNAGYPIGGSLEFAQAIAARYRDLGGEIHYHAPVQQILVEENRACGVRLADGSTYQADYVISAADGRTTIFDMLGGRYVDDEIRHSYTDLPRFTPYTQVALGIARDLAHEPHAAIFPLAQPLLIAGTPRSRISYTHYGFDPTLAPAGKTALIVTLPSEYAYWKAIAQDHDHYASEKTRVAMNVAFALEQRFPSITQQIEVIDVVTPLTYEQFTGNWEGCPEGWMITTKTTGLMSKGMRKTLPGLDHFYMAGQWVEPGGGLPTAAASGRNAIQLICHHDRQPFITSVAED